MKQYATRPPRPVRRCGRSSPVERSRRDARSAARSSSGRCDRPSSRLRTARDLAPARGHRGVLLVSWTVGPGPDCRAPRSCWLPWLEYAASGSSTAVKQAPELGREDERLRVACSRTGSGARTGWGAARRDRNVTNRTLRLLRGAGDLDPADLRGVLDHTDAPVQVPHPERRRLPSSSRSWPGSRRASTGDLGRDLGDLLLIRERLWLAHDLSPRHPDPIDRVPGQPTLLTATANSLWSTCSTLRRVSVEVRGWRSTRNRFTSSRRTSPTSPAGEARFDVLCPPGFVGGEGTEPRSQPDWELSAGAQDCR